MKFAADPPYSDPEKAARKLIEIADSVEAVQDGRIYIELVNGPFLFGLKATPDEFLAGLNCGNRTRLAGSARVRDLCEVHTNRHRAVRLIAVLLRKLSRARMRAADRSVHRCHIEQRAMLSLA
jgi:hypothetical protein